MTSRDELRADDGREAGYQAVHASGVITQDAATNARLWRAVEAYRVGAEAGRRPVHSEPKAPTDDEREALIADARRAAGALEEYEFEGIAGDAAGLLNRLADLTAGFHRSEVPEPNWDTRVQKLREAVAAQTGSYLSIEGAEAVLETVSSEPQGQPSDVQVLIRDLRKLLNAHSLHGDVPADEIDALLDRHDDRAASAVNEQGEPSRGA